MSWVGSLCALPRPRAYVLRSNGLLRCRTLRQPASLGHVCPLRSRSPHRHPSRRGTRRRRRTSAPSWPARSHSAGRLHGREGVGRPPHARRRRARRLAQRGRARRPQRADRACRIVMGAHAAGDARRPNAAQRGRARRARRVRRGARVPPARGRTAQRRIGRPVERRARLGGATSGAAAALHSGDHSL